MFVKSILPQITCNSIYFPYTQMRNLLLSDQVFPLQIMCHFSLAAFKILLSLVFKSLFICLFLQLILFGIHLASWVCRIMYFTKLGKFSAIISSNTPLNPLFFPSSSDADDENAGSFVVSLRSLTLCSFCFHLFSLCCLNWENSIALSLSLWILSSVEPIQ